MNNREKPYYTIAEFMSEFGHEMDLYIINGEVNYNQILIGSQTVFIDKQIVPEIRSYLQMKADNQIDFNNYFIEAKYLMYIPTYQLKSNKLSSYSAGLDPVIKNSSTFKIPHGIKIIESQAFWDWDNLTEIFIPDTVTEIEPAAFDCCKNLKLIHCESDHYAVLNNVLYSSDLTTLIVCPAGNQSDNFNIPNHVHKIEAGAFAYCKFNNINIPGSVREIETHAFFECNNLKAIKIPDSVEYIGDGAFVCHSVIEIQSNSSRYQTLDGALYTSDLSKLITYPNGRISKEFEISNETKHIAQYAISSYSLETVRFSKSITHIETEAFVNCINLKEVHLTESIEFIGKDPFLFCMKLKDIYVPEGALSKFLQFEALTESIMSYNFIEE